MAVQQAPRSANRAGPQARRRIGASVQANLPVAALYERAIEAGEGLLASNGPLVVRTGSHTGRSPKDKFIVRDPATEDTIWWGAVNQPISR